MAGWGKKKLESIIENNPSKNNQPGRVNKKLEWKSQVKQPSERMKEPSEKRNNYRKLTLQK